MEGNKLDEHKDKEIHVKINLMMDDKILAYNDTVILVQGRDVIARYVLEENLEGFTQILESISDGQFHGIVVLDETMCRLNAVTANGVSDFFDVVMYWLNKKKIKCENCPTMQRLISMLY